MKVLKNDYDGFPNSILSAPQKCWRKGCYHAIEDFPVAEPRRISRISQGLASVSGTGPFSVLKKVHKGLSKHLIPQADFWWSYADLRGPDLTIHVFSIR